MGFTLNPCGLCIANKVIDGKQHTIVWNTDYRKMSHKDKSMVESIVCEIEKKFGKMSSVSCVPDYDFLVLKLKFMNLKVRVDVRKHLRKVFDMLGEPNLTPEMSPSKNSLLRMDPDSPKAK